MMYSDYSKISNSNKLIKLINKTSSSPMESQQNLKQPFNDKLFLDLITHGQPFTKDEVAVIKNLILYDRRVNCTKVYYLVNADNVISNLSKCKSIDYNFRGCPIISYAIELTTTQSYSVMKDIIKSYSSSWKLLQILFHGVSEPNIVVGLYRPDSPIWYIAELDSKGGSSIITASDFIKARGDSSAQRMVTTS